ncbi:hypothetical protein Tco_1390767 [Tanacetum coccineum]
MQALKESKKPSKRQPGTGGSSKGTGRITRVLDESIVISVTSSKGTGTKPAVPVEEKVSIEEKEDDEKKDDTDDDKSIDLEMTDDEETDDEVLQNTDAAEANAKKNEEAKDDSKKAELPPTSSSLSVSSGFGDQFLKLSSDISIIKTVKDTTDAEISSLLDIKIQSEPLVLTPVQETPLVALVTTLPPLSVSTIPHASLQKLTAPIPLLPITTNAPTITTTVPESDALSVVQLRVAKLENDMFELKKIDHSAKALATLKSQVPTILKIKKEQAEKQKMPKYTIKSTNKAALKEYDQKSALYQTMHENKSFNKNSANHRLYHALMKALIEDKNAMDKGVADTGKKTKRRRTKELESSKKPSSTKETPKGKALSKGSKTGKSAFAKEPVEEPIAEVVTDDANEDVVHDDDQPQDTSEPKTAKTPNPEWFTQPPKPPTPDPEWNKHQVILGQPEQPWFNEMVSAIKDPLTFNDLMATPIDFSKYVLNRLKIDNLTQDILLGPAYNLLKGTCTSTIELEYHFQECFNSLIDKLDWNNPEGDRYPFDLSKPLPLQGRPGHLTVAADYFFNNDLEYLKSFDLERTYTTSITKTKSARYEIVGIEDMVPTLWSPTKVGYDKDALKGIKHWGERRKLWYISQMNKFSKQNVYSTQKFLGVRSVSVKKLHGYGHLEEVMVKRADRQLCKFKEGDFEDLHLNDIEDMLLLAVQHKLFHLNESDIKRVMRADELYKFSNETLKKVRDEIHHRVLDFHLGYNNEMSRRKWTAIDRNRSQLMVELIDKKMRERMIIRNLKRLVGARELEMDYKLMTRTV